jgi:hypothetical protein
MSAFGSLADLAKGPRHVRCYPDSRHGSAPSVRPLSAITGREQMQQQDRAEAKTYSITSSARASN